MGAPAQNMRATEFMADGCTFADILDVEFPVLPTCESSAGESAILAKLFMNSKLYGYLNHMSVAAPQLFRQPGGCHSGLLRKSSSE